MDVIEQVFLIIGQYNQQIPWLEFIGVSFGVAQVLFARINKIWLYPCGLISICITAFLYWNTKLYAEILLQFYYFVMSIYGWILWSKKGGKEEKITVSNKQDKQVSLLIVTVSWVLLYLFLKRLTNSDVPLWDSLVSAFAWAGMWLLAKRKLENWIYLNISNIISIPLLIHKGLVLYSLLAVFLFVVAIFGYKEWKKIISLHKE